LRATDTNSRDYPLKTAEQIDKHPRAVLRRWQRGRSAVNLYRDTDRFTVAKRQESAAKGIFVTI
jgi:hypothetical protein